MRTITTADLMEALNHPELGDPGTCLYKSPISGQRCIVGCLLKDDELRTLVNNGHNCFSIEVLLRENTLNVSFSFDVVKIQRMFDNNRYSKEEFIKTIRDMNLKDR